MANETQEPTKTEEAKLQKLAEAFTKTGAIEPGYRFRHVTTGGQTVVRVTPIEKKG